MNKYFSTATKTCLAFAFTQTMWANAQNVSLNQQSIDHLSFNRIAMELNFPVFWQLTKEGEEELTPKNVHFIWGLSEDSAEEWIENGQFTLKFYEALDKILTVFRFGHDESGLSETEKHRRELVRQELAMGMPTLVESNFSNNSPGEQKMVQHILKAARLIETIYARQLGSFPYREKIKFQDSASRTLFYRNQSPWCEAPGASRDPLCNAFAEAPEKISGLYPEAIQTDEQFCDKLANMENASELLNPFTVVVDSNGALNAVPYHLAYRDEMKQISRELQDASEALQGSSESALRAYLQAASAAFLDNNWLPADEAWSKMNANNSKWYLRIGPDEVYFEPCSQKAGFHVSFATINQDSKIWQEKLDPLKLDMENQLAEFAGAPYEARQVSFHLPDFIDIVLNAGESRAAIGATIGQSLPNWGPVANEGRGRTVAMTNLYTDRDSMHNQLTQANALVCAQSMSDYSQDSGPITMSVVLHEAAHNLGPAHEYQVDGKTASEIFGGPLASMLEELKAQSAALYYTDWLVEKGVIEKDYARKAHHADLLWLFGHIARGMYGSHGESNTYSQLSAIQLGFLMDNQAISWHPTRLAANGQDTGCFTFDQERLPKAIQSLIKEVAGIKARGDKSKAEILKQIYIDDTGERQALMEIISTRWLRQPKSSFVYSID